VAELILKITGDSRDAEAKLSALERAVARTSGTISRSAGELNKFYGGVGRFATSASADLQRLERNATSAANALRRANIEARGGGRIASGGAAGGAGSFSFGGNVRAGAKDFALGAVGGSVAGATTAILTNTGDYVKESIAAYSEATRATAFFEASAKRAKIPIAELRAEVKLLQRDFNLTGEQAERALAQATRVSRMAGRPYGGAQLLQATIRAAAGAGLAPSEAPTLLRQIASGEDEAFDRLLGVNPSTLYAQEARRTGRSASSLDDEEKLRIRINAVLKEGNASLDAYNRYLDSAAGKTDRLKSGWDDLTVAAGSFFHKVMVAGPIALIEANADLARGKAARSWLDSFTLPSERTPAAAPASGSPFALGRQILEGAGDFGSAAMRMLGLLPDPIAERRARIAGFGDVATEARWQGILRERDLANAEYRALPDRIAGLRGQQSALQSSLAQGALGIFALQNRRAALGETTETAEQLRRRIFGTADSLGGRAGAQYTIEALGSYDPRRLSTEARDRLRAALDTEIKARTEEEREKMRLLAKISAHLEQLVGQQAPKTAIAGEKPERPVDVRITDASPTTTASITGVQRGGVGSVSGDGGVTDFPL
jgi:hypothetical protein